MMDNKSFSLLLPCVRCNLRLGGRSKLVPPAFRVVSVTVRRWVLSLVSIAGMDYPKQKVSQVSRCKGASSILQTLEATKCATSFFGLCKVKNVRLHE